MLTKFFQHLAPLEISLQAAGVKMPRVGFEPTKPKGNGFTVRRV